VVGGGDRAKAPIAIFQVIASTFLFRDRERRAKMKGVSDVRTDAVDGKSSIPFTGRRRI
jgi:hypothetical protein